MKGFDSYLCSTIFLFSVAFAAGTQCYAMDGDIDYNKQIFVVLEKWTEAVKRADDSMEEAGDSMEEADDSRKKATTELFDIIQKVYALENVEEDEKIFVLSRVLLAFTLRVGRTNDGRIKNDAAQRLLKIAELFENGTYNAQKLAQNVYRGGSMFYNRS
jgi:hypothetical protein